MEFILLDQNSYENGQIFFVKHELSRQIVYWNHNQMDIIHYIYRKKFQSFEITTIIREMYEKH